MDNQKKVLLSGRVDPDIRAKVKSKAAREMTTVQELIEKWAKEYAAAEVRR